MKKSKSALTVVLKVYELLFQVLQLLLINEFNAVNHRSEKTISALSLPMAFPNTQLKTTDFALVLV